MLKQAIKTVGKQGMLFLYSIMRLLPIKRDMVFFESNLGRNCVDNVKYVYTGFAGVAKTHFICVWSFAELPRRFKLNDIISSYGIPNDFAGNNIKLVIVKRKTIRYFYFLARSKVWVSNCRMPNYLKKRRTQKYIQTWHGTPLKKLALDMTHVDMAGETGIEEYHRGFRKNTMMWDYLLSQNPFSSETFRRCFDFKGELLEIGYPRNDILVNAGDRGLAIRDKYSLPRDKKLILYAPTWRDDEANGKDTYSFSTALDFDELMSSLGDDYVLMIKSHYLVKDSLDLFKYRGAVRSFDEKCDISELYLASDMLVTDYSSVMFDYSLLGRPMIFYCYDLEKYRMNLRGFYFDFEGTAPGPVVMTTDELVKAVKNYDSAQWSQKYDAFVKCYNCFDKGTASRRLGELIYGICKKR